MTFRGEILMNFMDMCYELFQRISKIYDLSKDVKIITEQYFIRVIFGTQIQIRLLILLLKFVWIILYVQPYNSY